MTDTTKSDTKAAPAHVHGPDCDHDHEHDHGHQHHHPVEQFVRASPKIGRNDPCPCGSGKKFKKCCIDA